MSGLNMEYRIRRIRHNRAWRDNGRWVVEYRSPGKGVWARSGPPTTTEEDARIQFQSQYGSRFQGEVIR